jgi:hypothetical protein
VPWDEAKIELEKVVKIQGFPAQKKVKLFRVKVSLRRAEYVVTNGISQESTQATQEESLVRWKIEQFGRELKQLTEVEAYQCRKGRAQCNHIHRALEVWNFLQCQGTHSTTTAYKLARRPLSDFLL